MTAKTKTPTVEESLAMLAAAQKVLAGHRLEPLRALAAQIAAADMASIGAGIRAVLPLMPDDPVKMNLINMVRVLEKLDENVKAAVLVAEKASA